MSSQLAQLQEDRDQYQEQLDLVLSSLRDDPGNSELLLLKEELESALKIITDSIAELKPSKKRNNSPSLSGAAADAATAANSSTPYSSSAQPSDAHHHHHSSQNADKDDASSSAAAPPKAFKVNESVLARWVSGDKLFYPARIMSVTGSATAPMYTIKFKTYDTIETLRAKDVRPITPAATAPAAAAAAAAGSAASSSATGSKRKADGSSGGGDAPTAATTSASSLSSSVPPPPSAPSAAHSGDAHAPPPPPPAPPSSSSSSAAAVPPLPVPLSAGFRTMDRFSSGVVSSAAAQLYPQALEKQQQQQQRQQQQQQGGAGGAAGGSGAASGEGPPPKKFKKIKATKQLEAGKSKWQEFNNKSKFGKSASKKDSMFRTPEGIHGRVGFTGSGQAMRKDATRSRHVYQTNDELD